MSYNWFEHEFYSRSFGLDRFPATLPFRNRIYESLGTQYQALTGHVEASTYDQFGDKEEDPVFPYIVSYKPTGEFNFYPEEYEPHMIEKFLMSIPRNSVVYTVHALDKPEELGGTWQEIGKIVTKSYFTTSYWGDTKMLFRHERFDVSVALRPEWADYGLAWNPLDLSNIDAPEEHLQVSAKRWESNCPFAFLFDSFTS